MEKRFASQLRKYLTVLGGLCTSLIFAVVLLLPVTVVQSNAEDISTQYFKSKSVILPDGTGLDEMIINGPPVPPPGYEIERRPVSLPVPMKEAGVNTLTVPAYSWVFGCSSVSGGMIAGYYDRSGWPQMYLGPTDGGVMPLDNSSWPRWTDVSGTSYPSCPLVASKNGVDGRTTRGSIDDYWIQYGSTDADPYITNGWTQHSWGEAIGDYMKTSQSAYGNVDGSTTFWGYTDGSKLTCDEMVAYGFTNDGTVGRRLFYQAKGYTVTDCYSQRTDNIAAGGFSYQQFKAEIDAGRPVMLNLAGHTIVGVGYDDASSLVYIHDTWDYQTHTMTWGTSYVGLELRAVSIVNLAPTTVTLTYDGNGNTGGSAPVDTKSPYATGSTVTVLDAGTLVKDGYTFTGWNTLANGTGTRYTPGATFVISADTTLYAQWTPVSTFTVTYNGNGNTGGSAPVDAKSPYASGSTVTKVAPGV